MAGFRGEKVPRLGAGSSPGVCTGGVRAIIFKDATSLGQLGQQQSQIIPISLSHYRGDFVTIKADGGVLGELELFGLR